MVATVDKHATTHTLTGQSSNLPDDWGYFFRIIALAAKNSGCQDAAPSAILLANPKLVTTKAISTQVLPAGLTVENFRVASVTDSAVTLQWDSPPSTVGLDGYKIEHASCSDATAVAVPNKSATSQVLMGLDSGTTYHYRIIALTTSETAVEDSDPSAIISATTLHPALPPVTGLTASCSIASADLTWTMPVFPKHVAGYRIQYCTDAGCDSPTSGGAPTAAATSHTVQGLFANTIYHFRIRATGRTEHEDSGWSGTVPCTTAKIPLPAITGLMIDSSTVDSDVSLSWDTVSNAALDTYRIEVCLNTDCQGTSTDYETAEAEYVHDCARDSQCYYRVRAEAKTDSNYRHGPWSSFLVIQIPK